LDALHALASVGERKKEEHTRALARLTGHGLRARARDMRVNGLPKSGPILAGTQLPFADLFCHFESVTDFMRKIFETRNRLGFCRFVLLSVTNFTRGIFGTHNRLGFWDTKNPSGSIL
jgi:hypothetical protein